MEFNQSRITVTEAVLTPIPDWIIAEWRLMEDLNKLRTILQIWFADQSGYIAIRFTSCPILK
jgi:hypothetical protein